MTRRLCTLMDGGFPYLVAALEGRVVGYAYAGASARPAYGFTVEIGSGLASRRRHRPTLARKA